MTKPVIFIAVAVLAVAALGLFFALRTHGHATAPGRESAAGETGKEKTHKDVIELRWTHSGTLESRKQSPNRIISS